jgi:hypothetical protein
MNINQREKDLLKVVKLGIDKAGSVPSLSDCKETLDNRITESNQLLTSLGVDRETYANIKAEPIALPRTVVVRPFEELLAEANEKYPKEVDFRDIFSQEEIDANKDFIDQLNEDFNAIHKLDEGDILIPAVAGILSGAVDCALGGFVKDADGRNVPGSMSEFIRKLFDKVLPPERIKKLEELSKVPYDAMNYDNKGNIIVEEIVDGLNPLFHHEVTLGHDPILGFIFGTLDMLRGTVTTIGFDGKFFVQAAEGFSDRKAKGLFQAIGTVFLHMISDVNGSSSAKDGGMGLPVPFMALFNKLQIGKIGDNDTIAELVKSMFYQGYDFRHFCSMSIPVMITEVIVRISYFAKRLHEGYSFKEAIPIGLDHARKPKLATMLFIAHSASTVINAGKVAFTKNPLNINYAQWLFFVRYSLKQLKWVIFDKPDVRHKYVVGIINKQWDTLCDGWDCLWDEYTDGGQLRAYSESHCRSL